MKWLAMNSQPDQSPTYLFCPYHGTRLSMADDVDSGQRLPVCALENCGFIDYGNPKPCVAVFLECDGAILLGSRKHEPSKGAWDIIGGFIDAGESAEEAVEREVFEETGLELADIRYLRSIPGKYGIRRVPTLNLCFTATAKNWPSILKVDEDLDRDLWPYKLTSDVEKLRLFSRDQLPSQPAFEHQVALLEAWRTRTP
jgi:ADP-ribose pyrophosphatase YjhB (NUDIX family)